MGVKHFAAVLVKVLKSSYPFPKFLLLTQYTGIVLQSIWFHLTKASHQSGKTLKKGRLLGLTISFYHHGSFINLIEDLFIEQDYTIPLSKSDAIIFDVGSNIGMSVLYFKKAYPGATIHAFEPEPLAFAVLQKNITVNQATNVHLHPIALSNSEGDTDFFIDSTRDASLNASMKKHDQLDTIVRVKTDRLSRFLTIKLDLVKIDVEGSELAIINDLISTGTISKIKNLMVEFHSGHNAMSSNSFRALMEGNGFTCVREKTNVVSKDVLFHFRGVT